MSTRKKLIVTFVLTLFCSQCFPVTTYGWSFSLGSLSLGKDTTRSPSLTVPEKPFVYYNVLEGYVHIMVPRIKNDQDVTYKILRDNVTIAEAKKSWWGASYVEVTDCGNITTSSESGVSRRALLDGTYNYTAIACNATACSNVSEVASVTVKGDYRWWKIPKKIKIAADVTDVNSASFGAGVGMGLTKLKDQVSLSTGSLMGRAQELIKKYTK